MDYIILGVIAVAVGLAIAYIIKAKKSGKKCIGCPNGGSCGGSCSSCCSCHDTKTEKTKESDK